MALENIITVISCGATSDNKVSIVTILCFAYINIVFGDDFAPVNIRISVI